MRILPRAIALAVSTSLVASTVSVAYAQEWRPQGTDPAPAPAPAPAPTGMPGAAPPPGTVPLHLRGDMVGLSYQVSTTDGVPVRSCYGDCTIYVYPGAYKLEVGETEETRPGRKNIDVSGPTVATVSPGSKTQRTAGLVMGIVGPVALLVGFMGWFFVEVGNIDTPTNQQKSPTPYVVMMLGGLGLTTAGWVMFGTAGTKIKSERVMGASGSGPTVAFGAVPTRGGMLLGSTIVF